MTEIKFECPACGQHMECALACGGDVIHCARCGAELRVPFPEGTQIEGTIKRAELIAPAGGTSPAVAKPETTSGAIGAGGVAAPNPEPVEVTCPICHSELRVPPQEPAKSKDGERRPVAELLRKGTGPEAAKSPPEPPGKQTPKHPLTIEEREQQIAAARQAHPIQLNAPMKPRLEYVLSGETPPIVKEAQEAEAGRREAKEKIVTE